MGTELPCARTVTAADLSDTVRGAALETMIGTYPHHSLGILIGARRKYRSEREGDGPETLMELLMRSCVVVTGKDQDRQCTDPRDKIYGLLGLASDTVHFRVEADYEKNVVQAYTHVARKLIMNGYMDMLSWCQKPDDPNLEPKEEMNGLPSWVPDFSSPVRDPCGESQNSKLFSASGSRGVFCLPTNPTHPNRLSLAGRRIGTIKQTGTHWAPGFSCIFNYVVAK
jgi:hypothetical protein